MEKQKAQEILGAARENGIPVCLFGHARSSRCSIGFVLAISDVHIVLETLSSNGRNDGWLLRKLEDVGRIDSGGRLEETLVSLYRARGESHIRDFLPDIELGSDLQLELLLASRTHDLAVRIYNGTRDNVAGFVRELEQTTVTIETFDEHGIADGETTLTIEDVDAIRVHDEHLQDLKLLARWHDIPPV